MGMLGIHKGVDTGPGVTKQSFADEVNINKIIARFDKNGMVTHINKSPGFFGDVSELVDYQESLNIVMKAEELFSGMSAEIRARFGNDPGQMIEFLEDPKNLEEAKKLGMVLEKPVPDAKISDVVEAVKSLHDESGGSKVGKSKKGSKDED